MDEMGNGRLPGAFGAVTAQQIRLSHPLRAAAEAILTRPMRDRGEDLYIGFRRLDASPSALFSETLRGTQTSLMPRAAALVPFRAWAAQVAVPDELWDLLARRESEPISTEEFKLWILGVKRMEAPTPGDLAAYERALRARAAVCLRAGGGGALSACAACLAVSRITLDGMEEG